MKRLFTFIASVMAISTIAIFAAEPANYYQSCEGKTGEALLKELYNVVGGHTNVGYDGLYRVYEKSDVDENGKIWDIYSTKRWNVEGPRCGSYSKVGDCYNREHSMPQSWFNKAQPMKSDAFHVYPTDGKVNGQRSNHPYGECANGTTLPSSNGVQALGKLGKSTFPGYSGTVFEPVDEYKGDIARTYFYMATAYNDKIKSWDTGNGMLGGNSYPVYEQWAINLLLKWHRQDVVSKKETDRNDAIYGFQKNRNPFIDHPELVEYIWGDKKGTAWYINSSPEPEWSLPINNSTIDFGLTATNYNISRAIDVKATNLTSPVSISISGGDFTLQQTSLSASAANAGTTVSVSFKRSSAGISTGVLTLKSGDATTIVNLRAEAVDGIPALPAANVTETSFTARWMSLGDAGNYQLTVKKNGAAVAGYPVSVNAEIEEYEVSNLDPDTEYIYQLSSDTKVSNEIKVTTAMLIPDVQYTNGSEFDLIADPDTPSEAVEVWIMAENITNNLSISVDAPFALSTDMTNWSNLITIDPLEERFYLRVNATSSGSYESAITITDGSYVNDNGFATASVRDTSTPWFIEDFENAEGKNYGTYENQLFEGKVCNWNLTDAGIWENDGSHGGKFALRFGKTNSSGMESATAKSDGMGTVSFWAKRWSSKDGNMVINVEYRPASDTSTEWKKAGEVTVAADTYTEYMMEVNVEGENFIRLRQSEGGRGLIDDVTVTDHKQSSVEMIEDDTLADWDSYCLNKSLVIVNHGKAATYYVYDLEGKTVGSAKLHGTQYSVGLPAGLYIVTDGSNSRRVVVK